VTQSIQPKSKTDSSTDQGGIGRDLMLPGIAAFDRGEFDKAEHLWLSATPSEDATGQALVSARS